MKPILRFPEFKDLWSSYKIEEVFDRVGVAVNLDDTQTYREIGIRSHGKGIFYKNETTVSEIGNKRVFWVEPNCFVVNIVFAWERAVAKTTDKEKGMIASHRFPMYKPKKDMLDLDYITDYFITKRGQNVLVLASPGGAGRNKTLGQKEFAKSVIKIPSLPEQQKIADFLSTIDTIIEKQQATVSAWEERKKGVIQKLFSQEVRFKADDGSDFPDWEEKRLGDVFEERTERSVGGEELLSVTISQGVIRQSDSDKRNNSSENKSNYKVVKKNDLAYNTMRMWQGAEGVSDFDGIVSPAYTVVTPLDGNNGKYFEIFFKQISMLHLFQRYSQGLTSDTWNLKFPSFAKIKCCVPCEKEQNKIVNCIVLLDTVIQKQKETLEKWQELKKGLLQQMFV